MNKKNERELTSHVNFAAVESTDVAFVNSTTSPDNKLALASLKSKFEFVSSCLIYNDNYSPCEFLFNFNSLLTTPNVTGSDN